MRRKIVAGNWKMNTTVSEGVELIEGLKTVKFDGIDVIVAPPFTHLDRIGSLIKDSAIALGAQNVSQDKMGAHTGEIDGEMLKDLGCRYVIVGHSECRGRGEDDDVVAQKIKRAFEVGLTPIICFGEDEAVNQSGDRMGFLKGQVKSALSAAKEGEYILAYEPIWAIGTGKTASVDDAETVISAIRGELPDENVPILYGGSVKADNVKDFVKGGVIDGVLVGGASLKADSFKGIIDEVSHA